MMDFAEFRQKEFERRDFRLQSGTPMKLEKNLTEKEFLRIVYVMTWTGISGGSKIIFEHCNKLADKGHEVTIVCHLPKPEWFRLDERIRFIQPPFEEVLCSRIPECDIIVATYWKEIYECVEQEIAPVVYFEQGDIHLFEPGLMDANTVSHIKKQIQIAPFIYTVSSFAASKLSEHFNVNAEVIPNAVDKSIFYYDPACRTANEKTVITAIGPDYVQFKNMPYILAAVKQLKEKRDDVDFLWITPGDSPAATAESAIVNPKQSYIGECLRRTDIYICASKYESFCLPVLEAMNCGAAVVTTDCGGVMDYVIDGENALLINKEDVFDMTAKLELLLNDEELRLRLGTNGLKAAKRFNWDNIIDRLEEYYREIARNQVVKSEKPSKNTISLCMIVKNEEKVLARCLDSVKKAVDEIIIVDTGSTDRTKAIAGEFTEMVFDFEWVDDFSAARNFAFSKAAMDYQMWMDADDIMPEEMRDRLIKLKEELSPDTDIVTMKYALQFDASGKSTYHSTRGRLFRRAKGYEWQGLVHECITFAGKIINTDIEIHHKKIGVHEGQHDRNLRIYENLEKSGKPLNPREQYYFARELKDHGIWIKSAYYFEKFLDGKQGWVEDNIAACLNLAAIYGIIGDRIKILPILIKSFEYAPPRPEICCELGYYYQRLRDFASSLKWFRIAASIEPSQSMGFVFTDFSGYIPNIESCVCCYEMGDYVNAQKYNEAAAVFKPDSPAIEINRNALKAVGL